MFDEGPKTKSEDEEHCEKSRDRRWEKGRRGGFADGAWPAEVCKVIRDPRDVG